LLPHALLSTQKLQKNQKNATYFFTVVAFFIIYTFNFPATKEGD